MIVNDRIEGSQCIAIKNAYAFEPVKPVFLAERSTYVDGLSVHRREVARAASCGARPLAGHAEPARLACPRVGQTGRSVRNRFEVIADGSSPCLPGGCAGERQLCKRRDPKFASPRDPTSGPGIRFRAARYRPAENLKCSDEAGRCVSAGQHCTTLNRRSAAPTHRTCSCAPCAGARGN